MLWLRNIKSALIGICDPPVKTESIIREILPSFLSSERARLAGCDVIGRVQNSLILMITVFFLRILRFMCHKSMPVYVKRE